MVHSRPLHSTGADPVVLQAVDFLRHPSVHVTSLSAQLAFLHDKGLSPKQMAAALRLLDADRYGQIASDLERGEVGVWQVLQNAKGQEEKGESAWFVKASAFVVGFGVVVLASLGVEVCTMFIPNGNF